MSSLGKLALAWLVGVGVTSAVQIRVYDPARHDRFTGFPSSPMENAGFLHGEARFRGVGWWASGTERQFVLVSPRHFVCAWHYPPTVGSTVRFLGASSTVIGRTVAAVTVVPNPNGQASDLALGELTSGIDVSTGVTSFPYLNLGSADSAYRGISLMVFGWPARAGSGTLSQVLDLPVAGLNPTRGLSFVYRTSSGGADDAKLQTGDSGSPSFATANGMPALVGVHAAISSSNGAQTNYDSFVPYYVAGLNTLMAPQGYRMRPAYAKPTSLAVVVAPTPATLRRGNPGRIDVTVTNTGTAEIGAVGTDTGNVELRITFPAAQAPDTIEAPGWVVEAGAAGSWLLRRALLAAGASGSFALKWDELPAASALEGTLTHQSDASAASALPLDLELAPSYAEWAAGLVDPDPAADPDGDGLCNLVEYAFGGDPAAGELLLGGIHPLTLQIEQTAGVATASFPRREDADLRGISYLVEWSDTLGAGSWTAVNPPGTTVGAEPWNPAVSGFVRGLVTWPVGSAPQFCRVRVELDEDG